MELKTYLGIVLRRKWIIIIFTIVATIAAAILSLIATPQYIATTTVRVATVGGQGDLIDASRVDINYSQLIMQTYATILTTGGARSEIRQELDLNTFPQITTSLIPNTELMRIRAEATDPVVARDIANLAAQKLIDQSQALYAGGGESSLELLNNEVVKIQQELALAREDYDALLQDDPENTAGLTALAASIDLKEQTQLTLLQQYETLSIEQALIRNQITIIDSASIPGRPAKPRHGINVVLGIVVGLVAGVGVALLVENLDNTLNTVHQIETITDSPTVGLIPSSEEQLKILTLNNDFQSELEAFRRLRTNIMATDIRMNQAILVTSAEQGDGKSTILSNLAVVMGQSGRRVLVIDCDLRRPFQHNLFDVSNKHGLTDVLLGDMTAEEAIQGTSYPRLEVITSGELPPNPTELLGSPQMAEFLDAMKAEYDMVLIDTPALYSVIDAAVLVPLVESVVLVVAKSQSHRDALVAVREQLSSVRAKAINVVINRMEQSQSFAY